MGKETEYKLSVPPGRDSVLSDPVLVGLITGPWQQRHMSTTYFDSPDRRFSSHLWTLRHRLEGEESIVCVKTPTVDPHTRGEWQIPAERPDAQAIEALLLSGAPKQLLYLYGTGDISPVCRADFIRRSALLTFSDGSQAEFAFDRGCLLGKTQKLPFCEIELEVKEGAPAQTLHFVHYLSEQYGLAEQRKSKFARARALK